MEFGVGGEGGAWCCLNPILVVVRGGDDDDGHLLLKSCDASESQVPLFSNALVARSTDFRLSTSNVPTKGLGE